MRASLRLLAPLAFAPAVAAACASNAHDDGVRVTISPTLLFPRGVLDSAASLDLSVYDTAAGVACATASGDATGVTPSTAKVASQSLGTANCTGNAKFCGSLQITKSDATLVFAAIAKSASGAPVANGCATTQVNQDTLDVAITMVRFVPPATCGNGIVEPTEQCDPPGSASDPVCDATCHTKEMTLSNGVPSPSGPAFLLWPAQTGDPGRFFAFFTSTSANADVAMRVLDATMEPVSTPSVAAQAMLAPNDSNTFPPQAILGNQSHAAAAFENGLYWYVFVDDTNGPDIRLRSFDHQLDAQQGAGSPIGVNGPGGAGEPNVQDSPAIAVGPGGLLFLAWRDQNGPNAGQIMGRTYDPSNGTLGTETQISSGSGNQEVAVAATSKGWVAVWDDGTQVKLRAIASNGTPSGGEIAVSDATHSGTQDHPSLAVLAGDASAVVWADHGGSQGADVFVQRFDANLVPIANDQANPINDVVRAGDQLAPAIAGSSSAGGSYVAAWLDAASGNVRARVLDANGGFLFNSVDGQSSEFQASLAPGAQRANPAVAIGGSGPYVAIGWDDGSNVYARRFPAPTR